MDDDKQRSAAARLAELRAGFGVRLRARLDELESALLSARSGDGAALGAALSLAHRLAGTAGSYGYDDVGRHAGALEAALAQPLDEARWVEIMASFGAATRAV